MTNIGKRIGGITFVFILFVSSSVSAQMLDSMRSAYNKGHRLTGGLIGRNSILSGEPVRIYQLYGGLDYQDVFKVYWGFSFMPVPISETLVYNQHSANADTVVAKSNISFLSFAVEYTFYRKGKWKLSLPVQMGMGVNKIRTYDLRGEARVFSDRMIVPMETGVNAFYYFNSWFGAKAGLGLRLVAGEQVFADLSGPYYNLGIAILFGELYRKMVKKIGGKYSFNTGIAPVRQPSLQKHLLRPAPGGN